MKKFILFTFIGFLSLFMFSCTKTCTCINANQEIKELEIDPSENCSDRSGDMLGVCS